MRETEAKILEVNKEEVSKRIEELGGKKVFEGQIITYAFDTESDSLKNSGMLLRIRNENGRFVLGLKKILEETSVKTMEEYEVEIEDFETAKKLLESLSYKLKQVIEKHRISFKLENCRIDIDIIKGLPTYLEIEAPTEKEIIKCAELLGFKKTELKNWTIFDILEYYKRLK